jgi:hypothetical protein
LGAKLETLLRSSTLTRLKAYPMGQNPKWVEVVELP